jgi:hypothetical protein
MGPPVCDRYKAIVVDGADTYHYRTLADYIHLNPVRARLVLPKKEKWGQGKRRDKPA